MTSGMDDVFGKRSGRPDHPDFWRISEILLANDGDMEAAGDNAEQKEATWAARTGAVVDRGSVTYAAINRTMMAFGNPISGQSGAAFGLSGMRVNGLTVTQQAAVSALWVDAFVAGAMFQAKGGHQDG